MNAFGGEWTLTKLEMLEKYLKAHRSIFSKNKGAQYFETTYVDAFAGTGGDQWKAEWTAGSLLVDEDVSDVKAFVNGSVRRVALRIAQHILGGGGRKRGRR